MEWARVTGGLKRAYAGFSRSAPAALLLGAALVLAGGCKSSAVDEGAGQPPPRAAASAPTWIGLPLSWEKLDEIERWLVESADDHDPALEIEARLELAEGRLEFARRDLVAGGSRSQAVLARLELARRGFEGLVADERASAGQRRRARSGLEAARGLSGGPASGSVAVLPRSSWRAQAPRTREMTAARSGWSRVTVHHSALAADDPPGGSVQDTYAVLRRIQSVHMDRGDPNHGWGDIGYHFLIDGSGRIVEGRGLAWQGAHARGANNTENIGICVLGDYSRRAPSPAAMRSLQRLLDDLRARFRIPASRVLTHKELTSTDCPGPHLSAWVERYRRAGGPGA
jgi:hypothetical protein